MRASVALEHSEAAFVGVSAGSVVVGCGGGLGVVCVEDSKARVLDVISLKTYTRITLAPTNNRPVGCEWMVTPALPLGPLLNTAAAGTGVASMQSPANK